MKLARFDIDEVLRKSPLDEVARRLGIETEKRGGQLSAICPYHQDTRPSLNFFPANNSFPEHFHCFACGAHGHAIDLVKQVQGVEFLPALQWLSQNFGIKQIRSDSKTKLDNKATIEKAQVFALRVFDERHDPNEFKSWCQQRSFDADYLYGLGIRCIPNGVLVQELAHKNQGERVEIVDGLITLGLLKRLQQSVNTDQLKLSFPQQFQDYFHDGRILIPIYSEGIKRPELVGFAGRSLQATPLEGIPKYLLSPGFQKTKHLFNASIALNKAALSLKVGAPTSLFIVEGFLDALRLQSLGLNAVALMGTSLSDKQFDLLKNFIESLPKSRADFKLCIYLDNDKAGFSGSDRLVRRLLGLSSIDLRWIGVDDSNNAFSNKDPDSSLRAISSLEDANAWMSDFDRPGEAILLVSELGEIDASILKNDRWALLNSSVRERILFKTGTAIKQIIGARPMPFIISRLEKTQQLWANELTELLNTNHISNLHGGSDLFLHGFEERLFHARNLAYHGSRRGELPCDEESWLTLDVSSRLFDRIAHERMKVRGWRQAAPYDAVHLPRKLTASSSVLDDPRRKVMPHPADLHLQQVLLNELLTQRHDLLSASGKTFSAWIPAVRWYSGSRKVEVTSPHDELIALDDEEPTLSFGYQVDMDVLEGNKIPSDQGMFRPYGQCWHGFMASLSRQSNAIGSRVHVLRLDAQRYYDSIQRYVVRDALLYPLQAAIAGVGVSVFGPLLGRDVTGSTEAIAEEFLDRICDFLFGHQFRHPDTGSDGYSQESIGIPQGPVLSAYIGTIALFPVDLAARRFMRRNVRQSSNGIDLPRVGYARYVDDIVLFADSEELLFELREVLQYEASKWSITLINKGERVRSGTPELVMAQLNDGRSLAPSVPVWEPPFIGDGEAGWGLGGDMPIVDRQCALKMLRHPVLMDEPDLIQEQIRQAMQAPDLRPNDLGLCARWLWWKVATELFDSALQSEPNAVWNRYWILWRYVCEGFDWASEFEKRGYASLYAVEGLDKLLDPNPWMEQDQTHSEVPLKRATRKKLSKLVNLDGFFRGLDISENKAHIQWRTRLVKGKARILADEVEATPLTLPQMTPKITAIEWLCMAAEQIRTNSSNLNKDVAVKPLFAAIKERSIHGELDLARTVCEVLRIADEPQNNRSNAEEKFNESNVEQLALGLIIENAIPSSRLDLLARFPNLLSSLSNDKLCLIQRLPISEETPLWALGDSLNTGRYLYRFSSPPFNLNSRRLVCVQLITNGVPSAQVETIDFNQESFNPKLIKEKSTELFSWSKFELKSFQQVGLTKLAVRLFNAVIAMQNVRDIPPNQMYVPFQPQLFCSGDPEEPILHLIAEPMLRQSLGVSAWYRDSDGRVRRASVPHVGADLWRAGWAVADALGMAVEMAGESGVRDEQLSDNTEISVEHYLLRQQLRKLQGVYLSEALTWREDKDTGLPRTVQRALQILETFDAQAEPHLQVQQLLAMEAETRSMAFRIQQAGNEGLRGQIHQVFPLVLNKLPLWVIDRMRLADSHHDDQILRMDFKIMLLLDQAMESFWISEKEPIKNLSAPALRAALALGTIGVGLRGSVSALWGLTQERGVRRMSEQLDLPVSWALPDMARTDPQFDYFAIRQWLIDGDWPALNRASPWQWFLALVGLLKANFPQALKLPNLNQIFSVLAAWHGDKEKDDVAVWPYEGFVEFVPERWGQAIIAIEKLVIALDVELGMRVVRSVSQRFNRNPHTDEFTDSFNQSWLLEKPQFTGLGADDRIARVTNGSRILNVWTETRRLADNQLLAVHTLDRKLGAWLENKINDESRDLSEKSTKENTDSKRPEEVIDDQINSHTKQNFSKSVPIAQHAMSPSFANAKAEAVVDAKYVEELIESLASSQKRSREKRFNSKQSKAHFRVALFQWNAEDTYAHPLKEIGIQGLPLSESIKNELVAMLPSTSDLFVANQAATRGEEHNWKDNVKVFSWHEHRRQALIKQALNACKDFGVQLLVLPEVSVRPETITWLEGELKGYEDLAVLAGTYRVFSESQEDNKHLSEMVTLLWRPRSEIAKFLNLDKANTTLKFERGKKYRAVAAHELFRPDLNLLGPLYTESKLMEKVVDILSSAGKTKLDLHELPSLAQALVHLSPPLRYCMELICSELFLLTSPANFEPLMVEMEALIKRFSLGSIDAKDLVRKDIEAIGQLLTVAQANRERRSVLLVPSFTRRSNDYWHAGQASVLASGTATVFCNAVHKGSIGGSCFIGINSVSRIKEVGGVIQCLTPYHGWQKGILQADSKGALSENDQALVVVDIDPIHVVSGKPRPQLLPEPMSLVAYLPVVELLDKQKNANEVVRELNLKSEDAETLEKAKSLLVKVKVTGRNDFFQSFQRLLDKRNLDLNKVDVANELDNFVEFFADPATVRERLLVWQNDRDQQPNSGSGSLRLEPAWIDFIVADLTCPSEMAKIKVPAWRLNQELNEGE